MGASINPVKSGLRARAKVTAELLNKTVADDYYRTLRFGIIVSKTGTSELTLSRGTVITAYNANNHSKDNYKVESDGSYSFAAVITDIPESAYITDIYYRPFFEYEDINGNVKVIYIDSAVDSKGNILDLTTLSAYDVTTKSICRSLCDVCEALYGSDYYKSETLIEEFIDNVILYSEKFKDPDDIEVKLKELI